MVFLGSRCGGLVKYEESQTGMLKATPVLRSSAQAEVLSLNKTNVLPRIVGGPWWTIFHIC